MQITSDPTHWKGCYQNLPIVGHHTPLCGKIDRYNLLFYNAEEERTVLGWFNSGNEFKDDGISESRLMMEVGIYPRYAYQESNRHFYECSEILEILI